ncbi:hypothetical protein EEL33_13910 [Muribaculaceae bacterium Isolate-037 (Harlan)]|nr:hypothetical protein EEL33_13910 [Muribaculaceae bacterium Isolate-037 (Harlan)]
MTLTPKITKKIMTTKTYGARGMLEWHLSLPVGDALVTLTFTGGKMGSGGIQPARLTTANPALQHIIENCRYYKNKRIILLREDFSDDKHAPRS